MNREAMTDGQVSAVPRFGLLLPVIVLIGGLVAAVFAVAWLAARAQDRQAVDGTRHTLRSVVDGNHSELGGWASDYAYWDDFVENAVLTPNGVWIDSNIGVYAQENLGIDITFLIDGSIEPYVVSLAEDLTVDGSLLELPAELVALVWAARDNPGDWDKRSVSQETYVRYGDKVFMAAAAVAKWEDRTELPERNGGPVVLLFLRLIDEDMLSTFAHDYRIDGLRLVTAPGEAGDTLDLTALDDSTIAQLSWRSPTPGTKFLQELLMPMAAILCAALVSLGWIVMRVRSVFSQFMAAHVALNQRTEALSIARDRADKANRAKTEFLAQMSHDLRTPLNAILGFSEVIALQTFGSDAAAAERYRDYARQIHTGGDHLRSLIDSILDVARLDSGRYELHRQTVALDEAIETCLVLLKGTLEEKALSVTAPISRLTVWADPNALEQILLNLVGNAAKYTPAGGAISIEASRRPDMVALTVRDTGRGMSPEEVDSAFELFTRGATGVAGASEGAGLGLSIVKRLIDLHGGAVEIESTLGQGTRVTFVLPDRAVHRETGEGSADPS